MKYLVVRLSVEQILHSLCKIPLLFSVKHGLSHSQNSSSKTDAPEGSFIFFALGLQKSPLPHLPNPIENHTQKDTKMLPLSPSLQKPGRGWLLLPHGIWV